MIPNDFTPRRTGDGSMTLHSALWQENYHSVHGAVQESTHVFIKAGLEEAHLRAQALGRDQVDVLEVGLGTGLNMLLTWIRCLEGKLKVDYTALEPFPLAAAEHNALAHCDDLNWPGLHEPFIERVTSPVENWQEELEGFRFRMLRRTVQDFDDPGSYDLVYFDAFGPRVQPEMWTEEVFSRLFRALRQGGTLVTYCAKGEVRRSMQKVGFHVERMAGPPGKREMLRARRP